MMFSGRKQFTTSGAAFQISTNLGIFSTFHTLQDSEFGRYRSAYSSYYLSLARFLPEMSVNRRWRNGPYYVIKYGGRYTEAQKRLTKRFNAIDKFIHFDFFNCIIHACIMLDRTIALSRYFLKGEELPSFNSFSKHIKFFKALTHSYSPYKDYAEYMRDKTGWYEIPLKLVRDKFIVHQGPKHMRFFGFPSDAQDQLELFILPTDDNDKQEFGSWIRVSMVQLIHDISSFLWWYNDYGLKAIALMRRGQR